MRRDRVLDVREEHRDVALGVGYGTDPVRHS